MQHIHKMINDFSDDNYKLCRVKEILGFTKKNISSEWFLIQHYCIKKIRKEFGL